jgi:hypothetical protein
MSHKLAPRSSACVFLVFSPHHKGYGCMDLATQRVLISRHVVFDESYFPFSSPQPPSAATYEFLDDVPSIVVPPLPRTLLRRRPRWHPLHRPHWSPPRRPHRRPPHRPHRRPLRRLRWRMHPRWRPCPCIVRVAPPAYMSLPVSGLTCKLLSTGTLHFPPPHVRRSRIPTGLRL